VREGILVRLQDDDRQVGWGEIAPIPWFGSETIDRAIGFCQSLPGQITEEQIAEIPDELPACQFGLESALEMLKLEENCFPSNLPCSVLLSLATVAEAEKELEQREKFGIRPLNPPLGDFEIGRPYNYSGKLGSPPNWRAGGASQRVMDSSKTPFESCNSEQTFKCKIGVREIDREMAQLDRLLKVLPEKAKLRLDANGGLSETEAYCWLEWCDSHPQDEFPKIEFIEQPLPPDRFWEMQQLSQQFQTPIALDESVATIDQLQGCYQQGWRGIFVIKPAIAGFPARLRRFCQDHQPDVVWSSALETAIGRRYIENVLIPSTGRTQRAIGFGVDQWFADDWGQREAAALWNTLAEVGI
jgi:O-succinylbenzoate synthase